MFQMVKRYAWADLSFKENRLATIFNIIQIALLSFALFIFALFLKGYSNHLNKMFNSPSYNRIILQPNILAGYNFISVNQFQDIKKIFNNGKGPYPKAIIPRYEFTKRIYDITSNIPLNEDIEIVYFLTLTGPDDPLLSFIKNSKQVIIHLINTKRPIILQKRIFKIDSISNNHMGIRIKLYDELNDFKVVYLASPEEISENYHGYILQKDYENYLNLSFLHGGYNRLEIFPKKIDDFSLLIKRLEQILSNKLIITDDTYDNLRKIESALISLKFIKILFGLLLLILTFIICLNLFFSFRTLILKKQKEIGYLLSHGIPEKSLLTIFLLEGILIFVLGYLGGWIFSYLTKYIINNCINNLLKIQIVFSFIDSFNLIMIFSFLIFLTVIFSVFMAVRKTLNENLAELLKR